MSEANTTHKPMGIGTLGKDFVFPRKRFRWTLELLSHDQKEIILPQTFVKVAARPQITVEETELDFVSSKTWIPGKEEEWKHITFTMYGVNATEDKTITPLFNWLAKIYDLAGNKPEEQQYKIEDSTVAKLKLLDGCGSLLETWTLYECWAEKINFGELDYSSSEDLTIEITLKYKRMTYESPCLAPVADTKKPEV